MQTAVRNFPSSSELHELRGTPPLFAEELRTRIAAGARCVRFEYCLSFLFVTVRRQTAVHLTASDCTTEVLAELDARDAVPPGAHAGSEPARPGPA